MKFKIIYYAHDRRSKLEGETLMKELMASTNDEKNARISIDDFLKTRSNREWFELSKERMHNNKSPLPYPTSIMLRTKEKCKDTFIHLIPKLCYLGIFVTDQELERFLEKNFRDMII